jgi:hypothetical protein
MEVTTSLSFTSDIPFYKTEGRNMKRWAQFVAAVRNRWQDWKRDSAKVRPKRGE